MLGELVEQMGNGGVWRVSRWLLLERGMNIAPKPAGGVVLVIKGEPSDIGIRLLIEPVGNEGCFAKSGRSTNEGKLGLVVVEPLDQVGPVD